MARKSAAVIKRLNEVARQLASERSDIRWHMVAFAMSLPAPRRTRFNAQNVARTLGVSLTTIYKWARDGVPASRVAWLSELSGVPTELIERG